jgi:maltooligosyltrehalose trehalohydrolase
MQTDQDLGRRWGALWDGTLTHMHLWAPSASVVSVVSDDGSTFPMQAAADGWHMALVPLPPGSLYMFCVDGLMVPDPAARCQPGAVDGWSGVDDPHSYAWQHTRWRGRPWTETVLYELHVGTFSREGTFLGALPHLAALAALGVTMVELMPVNSFPGSRNWGYDGVLPYAPDSSYGTPDDLRLLVDQCHGHGMSVVLDVVYNHFGPLGNYGIMEQMPQEERPPTSHILTTSEETGRCGNH